MIRSNMRTLFAVAFPPTWRIIAAAGATYLAMNHGPMVAGLSEVWWFVAAFCAGNAIMHATTVNIVKRAGSLISTTAVVLVYIYTAYRTGHIAFYAASVLVFAWYVADLLGAHPERLIDRFFDRWSQPPMPAGDADFWFGARTIPDLGRVCALYLEGKVTSQPGYVYGEPVDEETRKLLPVLIAANRAGFFTTSSQPAKADTGEWSEHAYVCGFAAEAEMTELREMLNDQAGLSWRIRRACDAWDTERGGDHIGWGAMSPRSIESSYATVCHDEAVKELLNAYQIIIEDHEAGRDDRLWPLLERFALAASRSRKD